MMERIRKIIADLDRAGRRITVNAVCCYSLFCPSGALHPLLDRRAIKREIKRHKKNDVCR